MKNICNIVILLILLITNNISYADTKIVYLDIDKVFKNSKGGLSLLNKMNELEKKELQTLKKDEDRLKDIEKNLISQKNILSEEEFNKKIDLFKNDVEIYNKKNKLIRDNILNIKKKNTTLFLDAINQIVIEYASQNSIDIILPKQNIIMGKIGLDLTNSIIDLTDQKIKKIEIK